MIEVVIAAGIMAGSSSGVVVGVEGAVNKTAEGVGCILYNKERLILKGLQCILAGSN